MCHSCLMAVEYDAKPNEVRNFALVQLGLTALFILLLFWTFDGLDAPRPPVWQWVVLVVAVIAAGVFADRVWLSGDPLPPDTDDPTGTAVGVYASQTVRKLMICEAPILLGVIWTFVADHAAWPLMIAGIPGLIVLAFELWPSDRNLSLTETVLDSEGAESRLLESFES